MKILIINGPNLNKLGAREVSNYGSNSLEDIYALLENEFPSENFKYFQSNLEGEIIDEIQKAGEHFEGLIINPGGYAHTSVAIRDALELLNIPKVEVHLSNLSEREDFRHTSITAPKTNGYISGFKELSYLAGVYLLIRLKNKN